MRPFWSAHFFLMQALLAQTIGATCQGRQYRVLYTSFKSHESLYKRSYSIIRIDRKMIKFGELDKALTTYICSNANDTIPFDYYRRVIKATIKLNNYGQHWDINHAASVLLYLAFNDGYLHPSQLTADGLKALDHAENCLHSTEQAECEVDEQLKIIGNC